MVESMLNVDNGVCTAKLTALLQRVSESWMDLTEHLSLEEKVDLPRGNEGRRLKTGVRVNTLSSIHSIRLHLDIFTCIHNTWQVLLRNRERDKRNLGSEQIGKDRKGTPRYKNWIYMVLV